MVITEKNITQIAGRVKKFIKPDRTYRVWHRWSGGMKKRFNPNILTTYGEKHNTMSGECCNFEFKYDSDCKVICITFEEPRCEGCAIDCCGICLHVGDKIEFYGNRINVRIPSIITRSDYCYQTIQII